MTGLFTLAWAFSPHYHYVHSWRADRAAARAQLGAFRRALELYQIDHGGQYPATKLGLSALIEPPAGDPPARWKGPYLLDITMMPSDPWGHAYLYQSPGPDGEAYLLACYGADDRPGGVEAAEDLLTRR